MVCLPSQCFKGTQSSPCPPAIPLGRPLPSARSGRALPSPHPFTTFAGACTGVPTCQACCCPRASALHCIPSGGRQSPKGGCSTPCSAPQQCLPCAPRFLAPSAGLPLPQFYQVGIRSRAVLQEQTALHSLDCILPSSSKGLMLIVCVPLCSGQQQWICHPQCNRWEALPNQAALCSGSMHVSNASMSSSIMMSCLMMQHQACQRRFGLRLLLMQPH